MSKGAWRCNSVSPEPKLFNGGVLHKRVALDDRDAKHKRALEKEWETVLKEKRANSPLKHAPRRHH